MKDCKNCINYHDLDDRYFYCDIDEMEYLDYESKEWASLCSEYEDDKDNI